jgi:hypothetical protein
MSPSGPDVRIRLRESRLAGGAFLFSGAALLMHILGRVPLRAGLAAAFVAAVVAFGVVWQRQDPAARSRLGSRVVVGLGAGVVALVVYDLTKWVLGRLDPSPFDPFGAITTFGVLLAGPAAGDGTIVAAGVGYHVLNGVLFGVAFSVLFGHRGTIAGVAWGLFLELFQSTLYPGWLDIRFYAEFLGISVLGHVAYGATLGYLCQRWLRTRGITRSVDGSGER